jgi:hypothetical protein
MKLAAKKTPAALIVAVGVAGVIAGCTSSGTTSSGATTGTKPAVQAATGIPSSGSLSAAAPSAPVSVPTPSASASGPQATPNANAQGVPSCQTSGLRLTRGVTGAAAGSTYNQIEFTNTTSITCTLYGYPGVALTTTMAPGSQVGAAASRATTRPAVLVTLMSGEMAGAQVQIVDVLNYPTASCEPASASYLQVYPPGQITALYLPLSAQGCTKQIFTVGVSTVYAQGTTA